MGKELQPLLDAKTDKALRVAWGRFLKLACGGDSVALVPRQFVPFTEEAIKDLGLVAVDLGRVEPTEVDLTLDRPLGTTTVADLMGPK